MFETVRTDSGLFGLHGYWSEGISSSLLCRVDGILLGSDIRQFLRLRILYSIDCSDGVEVYIGIRQVACCLLLSNAVSTPSAGRVHTSDSRPSKEMIERNKAALILASYVQLHLIEPIPIPQLW